MLSTRRSSSLTDGQSDLAHFQQLKAHGHHGRTYKISARLLHFYNSYSISRLTDRKTDGRTDSPTLLVFCDVAFRSILSRTFTENLKPIAFVFQKLWHFRYHADGRTNGQSDLAHFQ